MSKKIKKIISVMLVLLLVFGMVPGSMTGSGVVYASAPETITVTGAGWGAANGTYTIEGTYGGKPIYRNDTIEIRWDSTMGDVWAIKFTSGLVLYFAQEDVASPDLVVAWSTHDPFFAPVPTTGPATSSDATVSVINPMTYIVNNDTNTISNNITQITTNVPVSSFLSYLQKHPAADWKVVTTGTTITNAATFDSATGKAVDTYLAVGDKLAVKAEDGTVKVYDITVIEEGASSDTDLVSDSSSVTIDINAGTITVLRLHEDYEMQDLYFGIEWPEDSSFKFTAAGIADDAVFSGIVGKDWQDQIVTGDKVFVQAQNGTVKVYTITLAFTRIASKEDANDDYFYNVNIRNGTITEDASEITTAVTVSAFLDNLIKHANTVWKVVATGTTITDAATFDGASEKASGATLAVGDLLAVKDAAGAVKVYAITVTDASSSNTPEQYFIFDPDTGTITGYSSEGPKDVVIPSTIDGVAVVSIGDWAFGMQTLTTVTIPASVMSIGVSAFFSSSLTSVTIPEGVTSIGDFAFESNQLTTVTIPASVTSIGEGTFKDNPLTEVTIGSGVVITHDDSMGTHGASFKRDYEANGSLAGTYTYDSGTASWIFSSGTMSSDAEVSIIDSNNSYVVDNSENTIVADQTPITTDMKVGAFLANLEKHAAASWKVVTTATTITNAETFDSATEKAGGDNLAVGDLLAVKAEDGTVKVYAITVTGDSSGEPQPLQPEGTGTEQDPYLVATIENLIWLQEQSQTNNFSGKHFRQTADIDLSVIANWGGIGKADLGVSFQGTYDGYGYTINNMTITRDDATIGFFNAINNSTIKRLAITNANVTRTHNTSSEAVSILVGYANATVVIQDCYTTGTVIDEQATNNYTGSAAGIVAEVNGAGTIIRSYSLASISRTAAVGSFTGGLSGRISANSEITDSFFAGTITGSNWFRGYIVGASMATVDKFTNTFAAASSTDRMIGVLLTDYSNVQLDGNAKDASFFKDVNNYGASTYSTAWDFVNTWQIDPAVNNGYPTLRSQGTSGEVPSASSDATVSTIGSNYTYVVINTPATIEADMTPITTDMKVGAFLANLEKHAEAAWKVVTAGTTITDAAEFDSATEKASGDNLAVGDLLAVKAENGTVKVYAITVTPNDNSGDFIFDIPTQTITGYTGSNPNVVIPASIGGVQVVGIGASAFRNMTLSSIIIPEGVTSIGAHAFRNSTLTSVSIPESILNIGTYAFADNLLTSLTILTGGITMADGVFFNNKLDTLNLPETMTSIADGMFTQNLLTSVVIPGSVTHIGQAFNANALTRVSIGNNVTIVANVNAMGIHSMTFIRDYTANSSAAGTYIYDSGSDSWSIEVLKTYEELLALIAESKQRRTETEESEDGEYVTPGAYWATSEVWNAFSDTIDEIDNNKWSGKAAEVIHNEYLSLDAARTLFMEARQYLIDKFDLDIAIEDAETKKMGVVISETGEGIFVGTYWVTQAMQDTFSAAIDSAKGVYNDADATQEEVTTAIAALVAATNSYTPVQGTNVASSDTDLVSERDYITVDIDAATITAVLLWDEFIKMDLDLAIVYPDDSSYKIAGAEVANDAEFSGIVGKTSFSADLITGDKVFVQAQDGTVKVYTITLALTRIASKDDENDDYFYNVNIGAGTITDDASEITTAVTVSEFLANLRKNEDANWKVVAMGTTITDAATFISATGKADDATLAVGDLLAVKDADGRVKVYTITVTPNDDSGYFTFNAETGTITGYSNDGPKDVVIPSTINGVSVTSIGSAAFLMMSVTSVTIPDSVTSIGANAFALNSITSVTIPDSVTLIDASAFFSNSITSITIGANVTVFDNISLGLNGASFKTLYDSNKLAGTYTYVDGAWIGPSEGDDSDNMLSDDATLSDLAISVGTLSPEFSKPERTFTVSVANGVTSMTVTPTVNDEENGTVTVNGVTATTGQPSNAITLNVGSNPITIIVTAEDGVTTETYTITVTRAAGSNNSGESSSGDGDSGGGGGDTPAPAPTPAPTPTPTPTPTPVPAPVAANQIAQSVEKETTTGKETTITTTDGKNIAVVQITNDKMTDKITQLINQRPVPPTTPAEQPAQPVTQLTRSEQRTQNDQNTIQIVVETQNTDTVSAQLTGDIVKNMETGGITLSVKTNNIDYIIPAKEIAIERVAQNLGIAAANLASIVVEVKIDKATTEKSEQMQQRASERNAEIVVAPISFQVIAHTTTSSGETSSQIISNFSQYVERVMELPEGMDPSKITTGIIYDDKGTFDHVPTEVFQAGGKWFARLNSLTNSDYTIIYNPITVKSVEGHWSKDIVNDMASRIVIAEHQTFTPDTAITRGEFADYIVRALGLYRVGNYDRQRFTDVTRSHKQADSITIANQYGIINGYPDGTFRAEATITRQEAMTMYARAMDIVKIIEQEIKLEAIYTDVADITGWAHAYVKKTVSAGIFKGRTDTTINPLETFTRAEAATAIRNMLVKAELINDKLDSVATVTK
ncbi:hypothetical protein BHU72_12145 [Desulfuribacillus stibiiarsenatis]|uniref:SLH domain-containing protein n=1 Tax=Desulfuribacillus stibiiarsenatis TaxID=1390249 RepID=A0A1E5L284_9FIRM|nr:leucine-rich repeat protein [Desulfuribacillus stibiiarsenatis]OEH84151.1 hypothetical protein BHU72_12145 [Desulfuribacillus stibiiarsenatis]